jgi:hypothetical protein
LSVAATFIVLFYEYFRCGVVVMWQFMGKFAVNINVTACLVHEGMTQVIVEITTIDI